MKVQEEQSLGMGFAKRRTLIHPVDLGCIEKLENAHFEPSAIPPPTFRTWNIKSTIRTRTNGNSLFCLSLSDRREIQFEAIFDSNQVHRMAYPTTENHYGDDRFRFGASACVELDC